MKENPAVVKSLEGTGLPVKGNDIDTDRIIPARYLRCVTFEGLGKYAFQDERFSDDGSQKEHPLNEQKYQGASVLIANRNFGCGSSREHAPQALMRFGIKAIVGESFAEIFAGNCISLGIPVFTGDESVIQSIQDKIAGNPEIILALDVENETLLIDGDIIQLSINPAAKAALLKGTWNTLDELLVNEKLIEQTKENITYISGF